MQVKVGHLVTLTYIFRTKEGKILGSSHNNGPFTFVVGSGDALGALEKNILGAQAGDELSFVIKAQEAYGEYDFELLRILPRSSIKAKEPLKIGQQLSDEQGKVLKAGLTYWVREIDAYTITLDANHPLAGIDLYFELTILHVGEDLHPSPFYACGEACSCSVSENSQQKQATCVCCQFK